MVHVKITYSLNQNDLRSLKKIILKIKMKKLIVILFIANASILFSQKTVEENYAPPAQGPRNVVLKETEPDNFVDILPEFPGGLKAFREAIYRSLNKEDMNNVEFAKCDIYIEIDDKGEIANIKTIGSNSAFNRKVVVAVRNIKQKWHPAQKDGKKVKYNHRIPISYSIK